jgi:hypothetical protein
VRRTLKKLVDQGKAKHDCEKRGQSEKKHYKWTLLVNSQTARAKAKKKAKRSASKFLEFKTIQRILAPMPKSAQRLYIQQMLNVCVTHSITYCNIQMLCESCESCLMYSESSEK